MEPVPKTDALARHVSSSDPLSRERVNQKVLGALFGDANPVRPCLLGHYRLVGKLGEGGMGVVYTAKDDRLGRKVAIKLLRECSNAVARRRFVREARALAHLSHPNVVSVHDIGEYEGQLFIVMEHIEGTDLAAWLRAAKRSHAEILEVFVAAGQGLLAAHMRGIVHRDVKPANVMIGHDERIRVVDFGVALDTWQEITDDGHHAPIPEWLDLDPNSVTESGALVGTPAYMAPEQLRGEEADPRTDQFSFCAALWEALYGSRPFDACTVRALLELMENSRLADVPHTDVPAWLHAVVVRGLSANPDDRWPSFDALLRALRPPIRPISRWAMSLVVILALLTGLFLASQGTGSTAVERHDRIEMVKGPFEREGHSHPGALDTSGLEAGDMGKSPTPPPQPDSTEPEEIGSLAPTMIPHTDRPEASAHELPPIEETPDNVDNPGPVDLYRHETRIASNAATSRVVETHSSIVLSHPHAEHPPSCTSLLSCLRPRTHRDDGPAVVDQAPRRLLEGSTP